MKITANQITLSRILLLPIPCYLVYGSLPNKIAGFFIFMILGFTDYIDGILARRHGTTVLGSLMDPAADKIFLAAIFIPLGDMGIIPLWTVFLLLAREFAVTVLRSIFLAFRLEFQTSEFAKYKTNVQFGGAGFIFLTYLFKDSFTGLAIFAGVSVLALLMVLLVHFFAGPAGPRSLVAALMMTVAFGTRVLLSPTASIAVYITIVLFFTLLSGLQYAVNGWRQITRKSLRLKPRQWYLLLFYSLLLPAILVGTLYYTKLMTWAVIVTFAIEFAGRGLDNHVTYCGKELHLPSELAKSALQTLAGATALFAGFYEFHGNHFLFASALTAVVVVTCIYNCLIFYRNWGLLR